MFHLQNNPGRTALADGKEHLFFSGYSYLGMQHVPEFVELVKEGIDRYGLLFPSSRISNTQLNLFYEFETMLAEITGFEAAVCFPSGFMAGRAVMDILKTKVHSCAPNTHPAIFPGKSSHENFSEWTKDTGDAEVLCFDSVNPLTATTNDTSFIDEITTEISCVIDDSHGAGLLNNGMGIAPSLRKKNNIRYIIPFSLSKSYGLSGGAVVCSGSFAVALRTSAQYTASTSVSPAFAYAFLKGQHLYDQQRQKLQKNIAFFNRITANRYSSDSQLPIFVLSTINEQKFADAGIIISSFAYPDPNGVKVNRIVLNALHTEEDIRHLVTALEP